MQTEKYVYNSDDPCTQNCPPQDCPPRRQLWVSPSRLLLDATIQKKSSGLGNLTRLHQLLWEQWFLQNHINQWFYIIMLIHILKISGMKYFFLNNRIIQCFLLQFITQKLIQGDIWLHLIDSTSHIQISNLWRTFALYGSI